MAKKEKPTPEYDSGRETRVVLERMEQSIKTVGEQHGSIIKKLEEHDKRFDRLETAVSELGLKVKYNTSKVDELNTKVDRIEQKLDTVTADHEKRIKKLELV